VLTLLQSTTIPANAFIFILTSRLGNVTISETNTELHGKLVAVIENITSARDKVRGLTSICLYYENHYCCCLTRWLLFESCTRLRRKIQTWTSIFTCTRYPPLSGALCWYIHTYMHGHRFFIRFVAHTQDTLSKLDMESQNPMRSNNVCMSELSNSPSNENENINVSNTVDSRGMVHTHTLIHTYIMHAYCIDRN
jgi:hypothetical protein